MSFSNHTRCFPHDCREEHRLWLEDSAAACAKKDERRSIGSSSWSNSNSIARNIPGSFRAANNNASPLPARLLTSHRSCYLTSRLAHSMRRRVCTCAARFARCCDRSKVPSIFITHDQEEALGIGRSHRRPQRRQARTNRHARSSLQSTSDGIRRDVSRRRESPAGRRHERLCRNWHRPTSG